MTQSPLNRRHVLAAAGGAAATGLAGCLDGIGSFGGGGDAMTAYVVVYHWGFAAFDENGEELETIEVQPGTDLTIHAINDHAYDAFEAVPESVKEVLEGFDGLERTRAKVDAGELPEPEHSTVEEVYEEAHGHGHDDDDGHDDHDDGHGDHDDGHDDHDDGHGDHDDGHDDHDDGHGDHDDATLDHGFIIPDLDIVMDVPADSDEPVTATAVVGVDEGETLLASCTVPCGYYHGDQTVELIRVTS